MQLEGRILLYKVNYMYWYVSRQTVGGNIYISEMIV